MRRLLPLTLTLLLASTTLEAQTPGDTAARGAIPRPANDSIFRRARRLVSEGNGVSGRALVDSILRATNPATPAYGEALYWHGALAPTAAEAERDYRRVIVEYPLSYYADDALLSIAELEQARGDRAGALQHLQRFVREHPASPARGIAALGAARLAFEQRDQKTGCAMLTEARASASAADVELRNQIEYYGGRCSDAATASAPSTPAVPSTTQPAVPQPPAATPARPSIPAASPPVARTTTPPSGTPAPAARASRGSEPSQPPVHPPTPAPKVMPTGNPPAHTARAAYTIQVAAYNTRADAEALVSKLATRGVKARVSGTSKPFRVRLGFYGTRQEATNEVAALKKRGIIGFVTEETRPTEARSP